MTSETLKKTRTMLDEVKAGNGPYREVLIYWLEPLLVRLEAIETLEAKWRHHAATVRRSAIEPAIGNVLEKCANELAAALSASSTPDDDKSKTTI